MKKWIVCLTTLLILCSGLARADAFDDGASAYKNGDYAKAFNLLRPIAVQGNTQAQNYLGVMYDNGQGVPRNYAQAMQWYRKAADQGYAKAQNNLGVMYANGRGVPQDYTQALQWWRKAADQGFASAQVNLGTMYANGFGTPQDYAQAAQWYRKAADQGESVGQYNLGLMYDNGQGVPRNYAQAMQWYRKAAEQGDTSAQYNLGGMYANGQGVPPDYTKAMTWYIIIKASGSTLADQNIQQLESQATPEQISEALKVAQEWWAVHQGSNPMAELATRSANEFIATTKQCNQFPGDSPQQKLCINKTAKAWLRERSKEYGHIPSSYITGNDLARTFIEKTK